MAKRRKFTGQFKAQVAHEALRGDPTVAGDCREAPGAPEPGEPLEASPGQAPDGQDGPGDDLQAPCTSQPHPQPPVCPYLLSSMTIDRPSQV